MTQHEDIDLDTLVMSGGKTSGISSILATNINEGETLRIDCYIQVESGNLALILPRRLSKNYNSGSLLGSSGSASGADPQFN